MPTLRGTHDPDQITYSCRTLLQLVVRYSLDDDLMRSSIQPQPQELVPVHPVYGVQDWDRAEGAIEWPRMVSALEKVNILLPAILARLAKCIAG